MEGEISADHEALLTLTVRGTQGQEEIRFVIDTGFTGFLTLALDLVSRLGLNYHSETLATLADGCRVALKMYEARVLWDGREREVLALGVEGGPLAGVSLMLGYRVTFDFIDGGPVRIEALPPL
ncbi:MAG: clan AA aspartic protease [Armatimonadetes bacterium]|nr:clan AA aspartic protease [Armatimonadota bacterium]